VPLAEHPPLGLIVTCDFDGLRVPEMVKRRPVVVLSPKMRGREALCTVVPLSTTAPDPVQPYHAQIDISPLLPDRWASQGVWIKGDMLYTVSLRRLDFLRFGKDANGRRIYYLKSLSSENLSIIRRCVLRGLGLGSLTNHL
jgi:mRNA interferase MazF